MRWSLLVIVVTALALAPGCSSSADADAVDCTARVAGVRAEWERILRQGAVDDPKTRFANLSRAEFEARLQQAADRHSFRVVSFEWRQPVQAAPAVVIQRDDPSKLDDLEWLDLDLHRIADLLAPYNAEAKPPEAFEGFFLEARDADGVPIIALALHWRGSDRGGSRWTRFGELALRPSPYDPDLVDIACA